MDFVDVGAHCFYDLCGQQTFLPFKCEDCNHQFCRFHRTPETHRCPKHLKTMKDLSDNNETKEETSIISTINNNNNNNNNNEIETKTEMKETNTKSNLKNTEETKENEIKKMSNKKKNKKPFKCSLKGCKKREWMSITCSDCHLNYCRKHRFGDDHNCNNIINNYNNKHNKINDIGIKRQTLINSVMNSMMKSYNNNNNNNNNNDEEKENPNKLNSNKQHPILVK